MDYDGDKNGEVYEEEGSDQSKVYSNKLSLEDCLRTDAACELNISAYGYRYHFHGLRESPNQILLKRFYVKKKDEELQEEHPVEYIRCDVIPLKNEKKLKCINTTIRRAWTLPDSIIKNVLNVIQNC